MTKAFITAVKEKVDENDPEAEEGLLEFDLDGEQITAHKPTPEMFAILMHAAGRYTTTADAVSGFIDFFYECMDRSAAQHIRSRLLSRDDDFGLDEVEDIVAWMVEEWTGRPMKRRSASTESPRSTGPASKRTTRR